MISKYKEVGKQFKISVILKIQSTQIKIKTIILFKTAIEMNKKKTYKILIKLKKFKESLIKEIKVHRQINKLINMLQDKA